MAASSYKETRESVNYAALSRIYVEVYRDVLWEILIKEVPVHDLPQKLSSYLQSVPVHRYNPVHDRLDRLRRLPVISKSDCDISVLYSIFRNVRTSLSNPTQGWGNPPTDADHDVMDDLERIRKRRNSFYGHPSAASISDIDFQTELKNSRKIVDRLDKHLNSNFVKDGLDVIESDCKRGQQTLQEYQKYVNEVEEQKKLEAENKDKIESLEVDVSAMNVKTEKHKTRIEHLDTKVTEQSKKTEQLEAATIQDRQRTEQLEAAAIQDRQKTEQLEAAAIQDRQRTEQLEADVIQDRQRTEQLEAGVIQDRQRTEQLEAGVIQDRQRTEQLEAGVIQDRQRTEQLEAGVIQDRQRTEQLEAGVIQDRQRTEQLEAGVIQDRQRTEQLESTLARLSRQGEERGSSSEDMQAFKKFLIEHYKDELSTVKVSEFCKAVNALELFKPLVVREDIEKQLSEDINERRSEASLQRMSHDKGEAHSKRNLNDYSEIFYKDQHLQDKIYLIGEPGVGKTTFCHQLINIWLKLQTSKPETDFEKILHKITYILYVRLRHASKGQSVLNMIYDQICPKQHKKTVDEIFTSCPGQCLVLLDGLDEWCGKASDESATISPHGLPDAKDIYGCTLLTTSRPWRIEALDRNLSSSCRVVEIEGLGPNDVKSLSHEILKALGVKDVKLAFETFISQTKTKEMTDILKIPLMLIIILISWHEGNQKLKSSLCMNYADLLESLIKHSEEKSQGIKHYEAKQTVLPVCFRELNRCSKYSSLIEKLTKLAFNTLVCRNKENSLVFTKQDLVVQIGEEDLQFCLDLGIFSESKVMSESQMCEVSVSFLHKSLQEFLAAVHFVGNEFEDCLTRFCQNITSPEDLFDSKLIILFLCGLAPDKSPLAVYKIADIAGKTRRSVIFKYSFESGYQAVEKIQKFIFQCMNESKLNISAESEGHVSLQTSASTDPSVHRLEQKSQYIIPDVLIDKNTPDDKIQWLCSQERGAIKSLTFGDSQLDNTPTPVYVIESLSDMKQLEKLCVNVAKENANHFIECICRSISHLKLLKAFSFHVVDDSRLVSSSDSKALLQAVGTVPTLLSLYLDNLALSTVNSFMFPSQLTSLTLERISVSCQVMMTGLPPSLTELTMINVTFSESAWHQLYQCLSHSSSLKTLHLSSSSSSPQTFSSLLDLSSPQTFSSPLDLSSPQTFSSLLDLSSPQTFSFPLDLSSPQTFSPPLDLFSPQTFSFLLDLSSHINLQSLELRNLTLLSGIRVTNLSQLTEIYMYKVKMSANCWREFIQSLPQSPPKQLTVMLWDVNLKDERILSEISSNFTVTENTTNSDGTRNIVFHTNTQTITR